MKTGRNIGKAIFGYGAASTIAGLSLYGTGKLLSHLFRDVDPKAVEQKQDDAVENIEAKEPVEQA